MPISEADVAAQLARLRQDELLGINPHAARIQHDGKSTAALLRERAAEEASELALFTEMVSEFFASPGLNCDAGRNRMRVAFGEARQMAQFYGRGSKAQARHGGAAPA